MQLRKNPKLLFAVFAAALAAAAMMPVQPCGETLFTGLDDSAQSILAKSICGGGSLVFKDSAFAAVPDGARRDLLYRPLAARKTRDLAHQIDAKSFTARPFFQPFFPLQRALLPGLPLVLALATLYLLHSLAAPVGDNRPGPAARIAFACATVFALAFSTPWHSPHYLLGSYAEGSATLFAALAMALAFAPGGGARRGFAVGFALGASVAFHQTLAAYAIPIAAFSTMRSGRPRHFAALLAGLALPTAALVWSTLNIAAPYGNFLSRSTLRSMIAHSPDIAALARALAAAALPGLVLTVCALSPRVRRFFSSSRVSTASAAVCAAATFAAIAVVLSLPNCRKGFTCDCGSIALAAPAMALSFAAAIARRRGAACALIAMCAWASVPFFAVQGNETHVGLWSMRRALTPVVLSSIALFGASLERGGGFPAKCRFAVPKRWRVCIVGAWCLCGACSVAATGARLAFVPRTGDKSLFKKIAAKIDCIRTESGAEPLVLFDSFRFGAPFAATMGGNAFCISDLVSRTADTSEISKWMLAEALRGRPVFVCATKAVTAPIQADGFTLVPDGDPIESTLRSVGGNRWTTAGVERRDLSQTFLRVVPDARSDAVETVLDFSEYDAFPMGLGGGWARPVRGKKGRWAVDGAAFYAPVPRPGEKVEILIDAAWTPPQSEAGSDSPDCNRQTLRLVPPFAADGELEAALLPGRDGSALRFSATRRDGPATDGGALSGLWTIRAERTFDASGFPPHLAAQVFKIRMVRRIAGESDFM